jgi:hypothetical protein
MRLVALPIEVLALVAEHVRDPADLFAFSQSCRRIREIIGISLYSFITVRSVRDSDRLSRILADHRRLAPHIKHLHVDKWYRFGHDDADGDTDDDVDFFLPRLPKLRRLWVATGKEPVLLSDLFETAFEQKQLTCLRTCEL